MWLGEFKLNRMYRLQPKKEQWTLGECGLRGGCIKTQDRGGLIGNVNKSVGTRVKAGGEGTRRKPGIIIINYIYGANEKS